MKKLMVFIALGTMCFYGGMRGIAQGSAHGSMLAYVEFCVCALFFIAAFGLMITPNRKTK